MTRVVPPCRRRNPPVAPSAAGVAQLPGLHEERSAGVTDGPRGGESEGAPPSESCVRRPAWPRTSLQPVGRMSIASTPGTARRGSAKRSPAPFTCTITRSDRRCRPRRNGRRSSSGAGWRGRRSLRSTLRSTPRNLLRWRSRSRTTVEPLAGPPQRATVRYRMSHDAWAAGGVPSSPGNSEGFG